MNLIPTEVRASRGSVRAIAPGVDVEIAKGDVATQATLLGVRPEHLTVAPNDGDMPRISGVVLVVENLGSEEVAFVDVGGSQIAVRGPRPIGLVPGKRVTLTARPDRFFLFDPVSTRRLVWEDDGARRSTERDDSLTFA
jgi:multiple sugar transport system ATP-binding protein